MDPQDILRLYDLEMRRDTPPGRVTIHQWPGLTFLVMPAPGPSTGYVIYTHLDPAAADQAIQSIIDFFEPYGGEFDWKVYEHDTPPDLKERLLARGFVPEDMDVVLALDLESVPPGFWEPASASVLRVTDPGQLDDVNRIETEVWRKPADDLVAMLGAEMLETPGQISIYIAFEGGEPVSSAWIRIYPGCQFAELYGGATILGRRGRGLYTALVKARAREARARGVRFLVVETSPMSRAVLLKLGFVMLTTVQRFIKDVGGER